MAGIKSAHLMRDMGKSLGVVPFALEYSQSRSTGAFCAGTTVNNRGDATTVGCLT